MPKMKTHKGIKKRFRLTAKGKLKHRKSNAGHLMSGKSGKRRQKLRKAATVPEGPIAKRMRIAIGG